MHSIWTKFRRIVLRIIESYVFEAIILLSIFGSSIALTFEDVNLKNDSREADILQIFDYIFTLVFIAEMVLKWFGLGLKKYFTDAWCLLDFVIVIVSIISVSFAIADTGTNIGFLRVLRTLRALRPLRAISRFSGIKVSLLLFKPFKTSMKLICLCD